jgi:hypothetical protein
MFLDPVIKLLRWPLDFVRTKVFGVTSLQGGVKGDISRVKQTRDQYKDAAAQASAAAQKARAAKGAAATARNGQPVQKKKKMGLFSKKKKCPSCGEKLHETWDQCPYCGWSQGAEPRVVAAPAPSGQPKMRTMAIDAQGAPAAGGSGVGWLVPLDGPQSGELFQLRGRTIVGTAPDCDVVMREQSISGRHAEFTSTAGGFRVNDLGSTNGTYVNDKRVTASELIDNDSVRLGRVNFKFKSMS